MRKPGKESYSEPIHKAGAAFDRFQELEAAQREAAGKLEATTKARLRATKQEDLDRLSEQIKWLSKRVVELEGQKKEAAAAVGHFTKEHERGRELMENTDTKQVN